MKTVVVGEPPVEIITFLARRRALGQDLFDEVWEGDYHMVPAPHAWHAYVQNTLSVLLDPLARAAGLVGTTIFNLGDSDDYRVPDSGYHRGVPNEVFLPTAAIVVEVLSPHDETWEKFGFFARHGVEEVCVVDPRAGEIRWFVLADGAYEETGASPLLGVTAADLAARIDWPQPRD
jgi:Uma2 family endonuclease